MMQGGVAARLMEPFPPTARGIEYMAKRKAAFPDSNV
jgi:hypothetical protein